MDQKAAQNVNDKVSAKDIINEDIAKDRTRIMDLIMSEGRKLREKDQLSKIYLKDIFMFHIDGVYMYYDNKWLKAKHNYNNSDIISTCSKVRDEYRKLFNEHYNDINFGCYREVYHDNYVAILKMYKK